MIIPREFNGRISPFLNTDHNYISWIQHEKDGTCWADDSAGWIRLAHPQPVSCKFFDIRAAHVGELEKRIEKERADSQFRINQLLGKIQELRAIEVKQ